MSYARASKKPEGLITRGKTASNRLRRVDNFILLYEPSLLTRTDGLFAPHLQLNQAERCGVADSMLVDLGYGFDARTTLESAAETSAMKTYGTRQWFVSGAENLAGKGYKIDLHRKWQSKGWMIWKLD